jgi:hypothetical protein
MTRFDRDESLSSHVPASLDSAANELRQVVERQVSEIIGAARERAAEIEKEATDRAERIEREAERKAQATLDDAYGRTWRMLDGIDLLESGVGELIRTLRAEMEAFAADIGSASPGTAASREPVEADAAPPEMDPEVTQDNGSSADIERMIKEQVATMHAQGLSRTEAERFLRRFKQGEHYLHVLDEIYTPEALNYSPPATAAPSAERVRWGFGLRRSGPGRA